MDLVRALAAAYMAITYKYDAGRGYKWGNAYRDLWTLTQRAHGLERRVRTSEARLLVRLLRNEIERETERVRKLAMKEETQ